MPSAYHQFCPVAKAMELLDERWTLLLVRELMTGSHHFNELRRGVPRMSPTLLAKRLRQLVRAGIAERHTDGRYVLTSAGEELRPVVEALGAWGVRWIGRVGDEDLDPKLLLWDMHRNIDHRAVPAGRTVVQFSFAELPERERHWWLVISSGEAEVCDVDPGHTVTVTIAGSLRRLVEIWLGDLSWPDALRSGEVELHGPNAVCRDVPRWFTLSRFAAVPRVARSHSTAGDEVPAALGPDGPGRSV